MKTPVMLLALVAVFSVCVPSAASAQSPAKNDVVTTRPQKTELISESMVLDTATFDLHGTLLRPKASGPVPIALIIAGSGPTDRDGNTAGLKGPNNSIKLLAEGLAAQGIASLRYDKRGIGESAVPKNPNLSLKESDLRFDTFIEDAVSWGRKLRADRRFSFLAVVGHSEGSLIGMIAAKRLSAEAYISIAGPGRPAHQVLLDQLKAWLPPDLLKSAEEIINQLAAGKTVESVPASLNFLLRPGIQPYLISWFQFNPAEEISGLSVPVLIVQGTTDIQVGVEEARLLARANPKAKLLLVEGMNHVLKAVPTDMAKQIASYSDPALPVIPELVSGVSRFLNESAGRRSSSLAARSSQLRGLCKQA
jgi:pimeloyl-ACP methyl ester carboxylesterase